MNKRKKAVHAARDKPAQSRSSVGFVMGSNWNSVCCDGYTRLADNPEVLMAVWRIAELISSMSIRIMANTASGDVRIYNGLSRRLDITPNRYMTRKTMMAAILGTLLLDGSGNAVVWPKTTDGLLEELVPIPPSQVSFLPDGFGYRVQIGGVPYDPDGLLHFVLNPSTERPWLGTGYRVALKTVVKNLQQAGRTKNAFLSSEWKPSVIVKVDGNSDELTSTDGRRRLAEQYLNPFAPGAPWIIPAEQMEVVQVKPLSLNDLAISDSVKLDKQSVAAILGVPPYVVGVGSFNREEWNHFIATTIMPIVRGLEQEMTRKLLLNPDWYISMNPWALYAYDVKDLSEIGSNLYIRGMMTGNEVRGWLHLPPKEGLDELVILENFIPQGMIGDQKKLIQTGGEQDGT
ncbi:phage portal protein [uncultured Oscillibacter sp.]|uniref:phage portal protein n=1 Tax=uncultured Oscillibacter sp. TaxID=876091 RepID=UPI0025D49421|nr:phage portal protein [uncultured Oscillibacter sp.]